MAGDTKMVQYRQFKDSGMGFVI